jgi:hypothetical protein
MTDYRAELQRLLEAIENDVIDTNDGPRFRAAVSRARTALAQLGPEVSPWPVPGDAEGLAEVFWGRYEQPEPEVEELAQLIYEQAMIPAAEHCKTEVPAWTERGNSFAQDNARDCARAILARCGRPTIEPKGTCQPNGYAYRYPAIDGTITRFNHGQEVNGCRPLYAIPYWLGQPPTARPTIEPEGMATRELQWPPSVAQGCHEAAAEAELGSPMQQLLVAAGDLLENYARPTIKPVPVSERPWEREGWCDDRGYCWMRRKYEPKGVTWRLIPPPDRYAAAYFLESLPHHALPLPQPH